MAKYNIIPSSRTIVQSPISIGHKAEKGVEAIEFDVTAWVETYGSGTLTVIMRRWGDAIPYPIALEIDENNKATWTLSDTDTAKAGMAYAQLSYIVGDEVVKKSDIYTFRVMDSLTGEGEPPEAYESWLEHLTHLAAEAMAEVLDIEGVATDKTLTVDGGIADAKATGEALAEKVDAADYRELSDRVGRNTIALAEKADRSTTYTKTEVDALIDEVEVETDTTLEVAGAAADAAETGRQIGLIKADLGAIIQHEPDNTADNAYSVGDYFIMDNNRALFVVTNAISVGDTIASGVNVSNVSFTSITNLLLSIINSSVNGNTVLIKKIINQIVKHESDSVADNAYTVGDFFVYDITNSLFKVKANISVGDSISTATNVTNIPYTSIVNYLYGLTEDLKTYTQNALEKTEDVRVLALDSYKIYENAKVTNGSKTYNETSVTFTTLDTDTTINAVLYGNSTSDIVVSDEPYTSDTLVAEFDFTTTVDGVSMRVYGGSGIGTKIYNLVAGHNKIEFPKTHIQTLYFFRQHNTSVNTFTISNFILYQGSITENPFAFVNVPKRFNKIFTVGDSLTNITGNAGQGKNRWQDVVLKKCGFTGFVKEGGVGYTVAEYAGQTSIWECVEALSVNDDVDFVTFWGGTNDWSRSIPIGDFNSNLASPDTSTFYGAYISCVRKLLTLYPNKRIILIGTTPRMVNSINADWSTDGTINEAGNTLMDFTNAVKTVAEYYGLPYLDLLHTSGINKINYATFLKQQQHSGDNFYYYLHFTEEGELMIGDTISGFINSIIG